MELTEEPGREQCRRAAESGGMPNYRSGYTKKTVKSQVSQVEIQVPRDRNRSFEPKIIGKYSRSADGIPVAGACEAPACQVQNWDLMLSRPEILFG